MLRRVSASFRFSFLLGTGLIVGAAASCTVDGSAQNGSDNDDNNGSGGSRRPGSGGTNQGSGGTSNPGSGGDGLSNPGSGGTSNPSSGGTSSSSGGTDASGGSDATGGTAGTGGSTPVMCPAGKSRCECKTTKGDGVNKWIDTFEDGDIRIQVVDERDGEWFSLPTGKFNTKIESTSGGSPSSSKALHMSGGALGTTKDGPWATVGVPLGLCYDASAFTGITFWIKGNASAGNTTVKVAIASPPTVEAASGGTCTTGCYDSHAEVITLQPDWQQVSLVWSRFKQAGWGTAAPDGYEPQKQILNLTFSVIEPEKGFDFWIDDVQLGAEDAGDCSQYVSSSQFDQMFPVRDPWYTYEGWVEAAKQWPLFCAEGDDATRKREAAAFFAHMIQEADHLKARREYSPPHIYCDSARTDFPCESGQQYFGRGPLQLSWNYNYGAAGRALGMSLLKNPDLVVSTPTNAFNAALWWWMTRQPFESAHSAIVGGKGFGRTIELINGPLECGGKHPSAITNRTNAFNSFIGILGTTAGSGPLGC